MAAQTTALTEFADEGNSRKYTTAGHTASKPKLVLQRRRVPEGNQVVIEDTISVVHATTDVDSNILPQKVRFSATIVRPVGYTQADVDAALVIFRDIIAGDEFGNTVNTQEWLS